MTLPNPEYRERVIVMKVGLHAGEAWKDVVNRKQEEEQAVGVTFWGYGGSTCHPLTQVQPFALSSSVPVAVWMVRTPSDFRGQATEARSMSTDGGIWEPLPSGIRVVGSKYAFALKHFELDETVVNLAAYEVAIGSKTGVPLPQYLQGRIDKACARLAQRTHGQRLVQLAMRAQLAPPFAVLLDT